MLSPKQQNFGFSDEAQNTEDLIPIIKEFTVVGTFKVDLQIYDKSFAYIHMSDAAGLFEMNKNVTGLRVQINDIFEARSISDELARQSSGDYIVTNWTTQHSTFFRAFAATKDHAVFGFVVNHWRRSIQPHIYLNYGGYR